VSLRAGSVNIAEAVVGSSFQALMRFAERRMEAAKSQNGPESVKMLSYQDIIDYFAAERPSDERITAGALIRSTDVRRRWRKTLYVQCFLDEEDNPCTGTNGALYGRSVLADDIDDELAQTFNDADLIIFR
jgi:hypothetical protein